MDKIEMKRASVQYIYSISQLLQEISLKIHAHPELGGHEFYAVKLLMEILSLKGFRIEQNLSGFPTAFLARKGTGKVPVAFLLEYDALPNLGHACGHNLIAAMGVGAALALDHVAEEFADIALIGCPAEETWGAKVNLATDGYFDGYRGIFITHPGTENHVGGTSYASHPVRVVFRGRSAHIAALSDKGINALDALMLFYQNIKALQQQFTEKTIISGIITQGGIAPNIIPDFAEAKFTVRALHFEYLENTVMPALRRLGQGVADIMGAAVEMEHYEPLFLELRQDERLTKLYLQNMQEMGEEVRIRKLEEVSGSTDVGNVSYCSPTIHPTISIGTDSQAHTPDFAEAAGAAYAQRRMLIGAQAMALTAIDIIWDD